MLCGLPRCPILERIRSQPQISSSERVEGETPPSVLVGDRGYPKVWVGPTISLTSLDLPEDPSKWISRPLSYLVSRFSSQIYARFKLDVRRAENPKLEEIKWAIMSEMPVEMEARLRSRPQPKIVFDGLLAPIGPSAPADRIKLVGEPKIPTSLEKIAYDKDLRASEAVIELYRQRVDVYTISKSFSLGSFGTRGRRRIVPTRWAITAVDSLVGDWLHHKIVLMPIYGDKVLLYTSSYEGNRYFVIIAPGPYFLEIVEAWLPRGLWTPSTSSVYISVNREHMRRGLEYMDGGHYAMRLAVLERLYEMKRQASVLAIREIGPEYYSPVGVWQVREGMRKALRSTPLRFEEMSQALKHISKELRFDLDPTLRSLEILKHLNRWVSLEGYL